jgi:2-dehydropantoate 2-reductase
VKFGVFGAGAIGTYVGVKLSSVGRPVTLIGRRWLVDRKAHLSAKNIRGVLSKPRELEVGEDPGALRDCDVILVTVKSMDTPSAVTALRPIVRRDTLVVSLQNGLDNAEVLRALPADILPAMVGFNVVWDGARLEQATSAPLAFGPSSHPGLAELVSAFREAKEKVYVRRDIDAVLMGKLLINLNNGICAVAGLPIAEMVKSKILRRAYKVCIEEGLDVVRTAGRKVASLGVMSPRLIASVLTIPDAILFRLAPKLVAIDVRARSSTLQDLDRRKKTEIDFLNGEIVKLALAHDLEAPANAFITETVHRLEATQGDLQFLTPADVLRGVAGDHGRSSDLTKA